MAGRILVIGATGLLGEPVAHGFIDRGYMVRVMSRNIGRARAKFPRGFEIFEGDALSRDDVEAAIAGCEAVHVSIDHEREDECVAHVVEAAKVRGLRRVMYISGTTVCQENRWFPLVDRKIRAEEAILASGIDYTIFCPGWFMEMLEHFVRGGRAIIFGKPLRRWHFLAVRDFARMVVASYLNPEAIGKRFYLHGPEPLTVTEALQSWCRVLHPEIKSLCAMPYWLLRLAAYARGSVELRQGVDIVEYLETVGERGDPAEANAVLGPPLITLDEWLQTEKNLKFQTA